MQKLGKLIDSFDSFLDDLRGHNTSRNKDVDYQEAWQELDEYLRTGRNTRQQQQQQHGPHFHNADHDGLQQDYANLDVPIGAPFEEIRRSYKRLLKRYHPDRFADDPQKQSLATEITQKLNQSYQRIRSVQKKA